MSDAITYNARVYRTEVYKGSEVTTYKVRWKVGGRLWKEGSAPPPKPTASAAL